MVVLKSLRLTVGLLQMAFGAYWVYETISLYRGYHTPGMLYAFMLPNWILVVRILIGITGIIWGLFVVTGRYSLKRGVGGFAVLWILGQLLEMLVIAF